MDTQVYQHSRASSEGALGTSWVPVGESGTRYFKAEPAFEGHKGGAGAVRSRHQVTNRDLHSPLQFAADCFVIVALAVVIGMAFHFAVYGSVKFLLEQVYTGLIVALFFAGFERMAGANRAFVVTSGLDRVQGVAVNWTLAFAVLVFVLFALKAGGGFTRGAIFSFYAAGLGAVACWRVISPPLLSRIARRAGYASRECIVIGDTDDPWHEKFVAEMTASGVHPPTVIKFRAQCERQLWPSELKNVVSRTINAARALDRGDIFLCAGTISPERLLMISRALSILPRAIYIVPDAQTASLVRCRSMTIGKHVALEIRHEPLGRIQRAIKRAMDITLALAALILLLPLLVLVGLIVKLDSRGPVFFRQTRNGYRGRPFKMFKFRSMYVQENGPVVRQASRNDPRVTRVGRLLRRSSIDELPQLINILIGDMSLVGPRPHAVAHDEIYARSIENYEVRQHVKPGLTGWAQVNGLRGETSTLDLMFRRIEYDLWYAVNASVLLDCEILVRTVFEVLRSRNAY